MALMVGAMTIHGIVPGPQVMTKQPELFWGMIASMWLGNLMLVVINLPLVGVWVTLLRVPYRLLFPSIIVFCCIGIYSINNAPTDVVIAALFGVIGYWLIKHDFEPAPLLLGFVLGPLMEENLRRAMLIARGEATVFMTRPISAVLLQIAVHAACDCRAAEGPGAPRGGIRRVVLARRANVTHSGSGATERSVMDFWSPVACLFRSHLRNCSVGYFGGLARALGLDRSCRRGCDRARW